MTKSTVSNFLRWKMTPLKQENLSTKESPTNSRAHYTVEWSNHNFFPNLFNLQISFC